MEKILSNSVLESWDSFCGKNIRDNQEDACSDNDFEAPRKILKRQDGLIERLNDKTLISEDNRRLLND